MKIIVESNYQRGCWEVMVAREGMDRSNIFVELDHYPTEAEILKIAVKKA